MNMKNKDQGKLIYRINLSLIFVFFMLIFLNLIQFTGAASEGFVLRELNSELNDLNSENKSLSLRSAELQSIDRIKEEIKEMGLVLSEQKDYILNNRKDIAKR